MKRIYLLVFILVVPFRCFGQAPDWYIKLKQIQILESSKEELEGIFEKPKVEKKFFNGGVESIVYETQIGRLQVSYSAGSCEKNYDYNVGKGKVLNVRFRLNQLIKLSKFDINKQDFDTRNDDAGWLYYFDKNLGVEYETYRGKLGGVGLFPSTIYDNLKCENIKVNN